jgi:hypothetical protein
MAVCYDPYHNPDAHEQAFLGLTIHDTIPPSTLPNCHTFCKKLELAGATIRYPDDYPRGCAFVSIRIILL